MSILFHYIILSFKFIFFSEYNWYFFVFVWSILFIQCKPINIYTQWNQKTKNNILYGIRDLIHDFKFIVPIIFSPVKITVFIYCYIYAIIWVCVSLTLLLVSKFIVLDKFWYIYFIDYVNIFKYRNIKENLFKWDKNKLLLLLNRILIIKISCFSIIFLNIAIIFYFSEINSKNFDDFCFNCWKYSKNYNKIFQMSVSQGEKIYTPIQEINDIKITNFKNTVVIETTIENHMIGYILLKEKKRLINYYLKKNIKLKIHSIKIKNWKINIEYKINDPEELFFKNIIIINNWKGKIDDIGNYDYYYSKNIIKELNKLKFTKENNEWISDKLKIKMKEKYQLVIDFEKKNTEIVSEYIIKIQENIENKIIYVDKNMYEITRLNKKDLIDYILKQEKEKITVILISKSYAKYMMMIERIN